METTTITASITYSTAEIEAFADRLGYQTVIANPDYKASMGEDGVLTDNGESPTLDNPETRLEFVKRMFKALAVTYFTQFAERDAEAAAKTQKEQTVAVVKQAVEQAISI